MYDDIYLKRYTTALIKRQWGQNLSKFNGTAMLGGVTLNGPELFFNGNRRATKNLRKRLD